MPIQLNQLQGIINIGLMALALFAIAWAGIVSPAAVGNAFAKPGTALAALAVILAGAQLSVVRWRLLLAWYGSPLGFVRVWRISYISWFLGAFLPGAAGADVLRALYVKKDYPETRSLAFVSILLDRLLGLASLLILALGLLAALGRNAFPEALRVSIWLFLSGALVAVVAAPFAVAWLNRSLLSLLRRFPRLSRLIIKLDKVARLAMAVGRQQPMKLVVCLALGIAGHVFVLAALVILARSSATMALPSAKLALAGALAVLINQLPLTPSGVGVGELGFAQLCLLMAPGTEASEYGSIMLAFRLMTLISYLPGAVALLIYRPADKV
jgi:uncharacterized protein (TIRG00374 family)